MNNRKKPTKHFNLHKINGHNSRMILNTSTSSLTCIYQFKCNDGHIRWWAGLSDIFVKSINEELFKPSVVKICLLFSEE